ncbi:MAG: glycine oxidase ThiO [Planctomycetes bacterium]|nr:glycine oxidase ThiO [Planctomycetota bacterium]
MNSSSHDVLIVGGGVIGLSLAWELAQHGAKVCVVDRGKMGREASWAGAGMIPPGPSRSHWERATPLERMAGLSSDLHAKWSQALLAETGVDNEYRRCGALRLAEIPSQVSLVDNQISRWRELGIECQELDSRELAQLEPELASNAGSLGAYHIPAETQIRNPRHLQALLAACRQAGVELRPGTTVREWRIQGEHVTAAITDEQPLVAEQFCLTAGCWTGQLAKTLGLDLLVKPIRGQMVLLSGARVLLSHNVYVGLRYLAPRQDGHVLVGSTMEDVGFVKENTPDATDELLSFAIQLVPALAELPVDTCWSGLRPGTPDGKPYLGRAGQLENTWVATGHFRAGLQLSPATAVVMRSLILGQAPPINVSSLGVGR